MTRRILALTGVETAAVALGVLWLVRDGGWWTAPLWGVALCAGVLLALSLLPRIYVEHRRHGAWITPADGAIVVGLVAVGPLGFIAAATVSEVVLAWKLRQSPLKTAFNLVSMVGGYTAAAVVFAVLQSSATSVGSLWGAALLALAACTLWDVLSTSTVVALAERQRLGTIVREVAPPLLVSLLLSSALGLVALVLYQEHAAAVLLFVPVLGILVASTRAMSHHQTERIRFQRLYEATAGLAQLGTPRQVLELAATQARELVTGGAAVAASPDAEGTWQGVLVDDGGPRNIDGRALARLLEVTGQAGGGEVPTDRLHGDVRGLLPACASLTHATGRADPGVPIVLAVLRELPTDEQADRRWSVLEAFASHAAVVVANAGLHTDVQRALAQEMQLNRQKSEFVAAVSHELRTPLAALTGSLQTIQRLGERLPNDDRDQLFHLGLQQGERLRSLIEDLLLAAASDHRALRCVVSDIDVVGLVRELAAEFTPALGDRLSWVADTPTLVVSTDGDKLRRVLVNLVENARKYADGAPVRLEVGAGDTHATVCVDDGGPGIPSGDRDRIFERFVQLDQSATRRQGGTGLGLHLSRELAEALGGSLCLEDSPLGGARFVLRLPLAPPARPAGSAGGVDCAPAQGRIARSPLKPARRAADARAVGASGHPA